LIHLLKEQNPTGQEPVALLIPNGRSLLKGQADNAHPRIVVAADFEGNNPAVGLGLAARGQLFLGFVENANEIEVLSYNEAAGRFEFQLVQNYCEGCVPRIVYARRAICTTCHQNGGAPIFSQRPWNETNGQQATTEAITLARGNKPYHGVAVQQPLSQSERFDQLTDIGNFYQATQRLWLDGCGEKGNACRRQMLSLAFQYADNAGGFNPESAEAKQLRQLQAATFPKEGITVAESDLLNRDPIGEKQGFKGWLRSLVTRDIRFGEGAKDNEDLSAFDKLPPLRKELDPLTIRAPKKTLHAQDIDGVYGVASFFTEADLKTLAEQHGNDVKNLQAKVNALPNEVFTAKPFSRVAMMQALLGKPREYCCLKTDEMSPPVVSGVPPLTIKQFPELQHFADSCFACHRGNPAQRLNFMAGDNEQAVLDNIKAKKEIRDALDWERYEGSEKASKLMPPRDSVQYHRLKGKGATGDVQRQKMRDTVPSLFDF
jgi:mono/diheme cytochrome c family protein